jgi:curved DNA-binding protein CbpA
MDFLMCDPSDRGRGRNSDIFHRECYPGLGHVLNETNIGNFFVRCAPIDFGNFLDWSYNETVSDFNLLRQLSWKLIKVEDGKLTFWRKFPIGSTNEFSEKWNDGNWTSPESFWEARMAKFPASKASTDVCKATDILMSKATIPEIIDYSYKFEVVESHEACAKDVQYTPDFFASDPRQILGFSPFEKNFDVIKARYRTLALRFHPDKKGDDNIFKIINTAYAKLESECRKTNYEADLKEDLDTPDFHRLAEKVHAKILGERDLVEQDPKQLRNKFESLLRKIQSKNKQIEAQPNERLSQLQSAVQQNFWCYDLKVRLDEFVNLDWKVNSVDDAIRKINKMLEGLEKLYEEFDLGNKRNSWSHQLRSLYESMVYFYDKKAALCRLLAQWYKHRGYEYVVKKIVEKVSDVIATLNLVKKNQEPPLLFKFTDQFVDLFPPKEDAPISAAPDALVLYKHQSSSAKRVLSHSMRIDKIFDRIQENIDVTSL